MHLSPSSSIGSKMYLRHSSNIRLSYAPNVFGGYIQRPRLIGTRRLVSVNGGVSDIGILPAFMDPPAMQQTINSSDTLARTEKYGESRSAPDVKASDFVEGRVGLDDGRRGRGGPSTRDAEPKYHAHGCICIAERGIPCRDGFPVV